MNSWGTFISLEMPPSPPSKNDLRFPIMERGPENKVNQTFWLSKRISNSLINLPVSSKKTLQVSQPLYSSIVLILQLFFFHFSLLKKEFHNLKSKSTLQWGELFYFITKRRSLYVVRKYKIDLFFFFSSYETLLFKQPEWIVSVHFFKSHHIHLGMDVLGCWKSGPLVHRATKKSPDQQFQNVPFSYIASMHTS